MANKLTNDQLEFLVSRLLERARESVDEYNESTGEDKIFESGRKMAYFEMLDILKKELNMRDQDLAKYGLDFDLLKEIA